MDTLKTGFEQLDKYYCSNCEDRLCCNQKHYKCKEARIWACGYDKAVTELNEQRKWHDLRDNSEDLPQLDAYCIVLMKRYYSDYTYYMLGRLSELDAGNYWSVDGVGWINHPQYSTKSDQKDEVIAWKYIDLLNECE